jgi:hypothetical protein
MECSKTGHALRKRRTAYLSLASEVVHNVKKNGDICAGSAPKRTGFGSGVWVN